MITHKLEKQPKNSYNIEVTIPWEEIEKEYAVAFDMIHKDYTFEGYRKGKVPKDLAKQHIKKDDVYQQLLRVFLPRVYQEIVEKEKLKPIVSPKIELISAKEAEEWKLSIKVAEKPEADLSNYKKIVEEAKASLKKDEIWVPGKEPEKKEDPNQQHQKKLNAVLSALVEKVPCEVSDVIIGQEVEERLVRTFDELQKLGLTVDSYLKSKNLTMDQVRASIAKEVEETYKLEFILMQVAEKENITIEDKDLNKLFEAITDEKEREMAKQNAYFYASVLRKQKTLDFLLGL